MLFTVNELRGEREPEDCEDSPGGRTDAPADLPVAPIAQNGGHEQREDHPRQ